MAAPSIGRKVVCSGLWRWTAQRTCTALQLQHVRYMQKKAPNVASEKDKWVSKAARQLLKLRQKTIPNNWEEKFMTRVPQDDVWFRMHYPPQPQPLATNIEMHREIACPEMLDNMDGFMYFKATLDMRTSKKTKFIGEFSGQIELPYNFDDGTDNKVLVFCKSKEDHALAMEQGAVFAGGVEMIKLMEKGDIKSYMFDYAVSTVDCFEDATKARKYMRDKFPSRRAGSVDEDIVTMMRRFRFGKKYEVEKTSDEEATITVNVGRLSMPSEQLQANFHAYLEAIYSHRPRAKVAKVLGSFIKTAHSFCPPCPERLHLSADDLQSSVPEDTSSRRRQHEDNDLEPEVAPAAAASL